MRTVQQIIEQQLGNLIVQLATRESELDQVREELAAVKAELAAAKAAAAG